MVDVMTALNCFELVVLNLGSRSCKVSGAVSVVLELVDLSVQSQHVLSWQTSLTGGHCDSSEHAHNSCTVTQHYLEVAQQSSAPCTVSVSTGVAVQLGNTQQAGAFVQSCQHNFNSRATEPNNASIHTPTSQLVQPAVAATATPSPTPKPWHTRWGPSPKPTTRTGRQRPSSPQRPSHTTT